MSQNRPSARHVDDLESFYQLLTALSELSGGPTLISELRRTNIPERGVYFIFESGEFRPNSERLRVVRVGTHGLRPGAKSTLYGRLAQHRGTKSGGGNHRSSIFRRHVGRALINRDKIECSTWAKGSSAHREIVDAEYLLEKAVSTHIGAMSVLLLNVPDASGPNSQRGLIEKSVIALLSGKEPASRGWLGSKTGNSTIVNSNLWNVDHVGGDPDRDMFECFEYFLSRQLNTSK